MSTFDSALMRAMRDTPFVLASTLVEKEKGGTLVQEWVLCRASETAIIDHATPLQFFGKYILAAPEEALLERFYEALGAKKLSSKMAVENLPMGIRPGNSRESKELQKRIVERLTIFMSQHAISRKDSSYTVDFLTRGDNFVVREAADIKIRYTYRDGRNVQQHMEVSFGKRRDELTTRPSTLAPNGAVPRRLRSPCRSQLMSTGTMCPILWPRFCSLALASTTLWSSSRS
jgi:hypothetical protein